MRIIAGVSRGRRLTAPAGSKTRPTADRVKEAIFNVIGSRVVDAYVLDAYAGSGALAIEALSRGAASAVLIEIDKAAQQAIKANLASTGLSGRLYSGDAMRVISRFKQPFDIIFIDPPYNKGLVEETIAKLLSLGLISGTTLVVAELDAKAVLILPAGMRISKISKYGDTAIYYCEKE